jgi:flavin-dependent dehydrogenase
MSPVPESCDVVVIGGGPAGSLAAIYLTAKGYSVVLFEKEKHPRYQVGESLLPDVWKYCDAAGVSDAIAGEGFLRKAGGSVDWNGEMRRMSFGDFGYMRPALHVERDRFDHILLERARESGAWIGEEIGVLDADFSRAEDVESEVSVSYRPVGESSASRIRCRCVVDASGQTGVLGRQLGLRLFDEAFRFMSVWGYFANSSYLAADGLIYPAQSVRQVPPTTYVSALPQGDGWAWLWHIMLRESTSIGLVIPKAWASETKASGESWEAWYLRQCRALPLLQRLLADATFCEGSVRLVIFSTRGRGGLRRPYLLGGRRIQHVLGLRCCAHDRSEFSPARQARRASIHLRVAVAGEAGA